MSSVQFSYRYVLLHRSSCWTTLVKSATDTRLCWIVILLTLRVSLPRSKKSVTVVLAKLLRRTRKLSSRVTRPSLLLSLASPCASRLSRSSLLLDVLPSVICVRQLLSALSRPWLSRMPLAKSPRLLRKPRRKNNYYNSFRAHTHTPHTHIPIVSVRICRRVNANI